MTRQKKILKKVEEMIEIVTDYDYYKGKMSVIIFHYTTFPSNPINITNLDMS